MGNKIRLTEGQLKNIIRSAVMSAINEEREPSWDGRMRQAGAGLNVAKKKMDSVYKNDGSVSDKFKSLGGYDEALRELVRAIKDFSSKGGTEDEIQDIISDTLKDSWPKARYSKGVLDWEPKD